MERAGSPWAAGQAVVAAVVGRQDVWAADSRAAATYWSPEASDRARTLPGLEVEDRCRQASAARDKNCAATGKRAVGAGLGRPWWNVSDEAEWGDVVVAATCTCREAGGWLKRGAGRGGAALHWTATSGQGRTGQDSSSLSRCGWYLSECQASDANRRAKRAWTRVGRRDGGRTSQKDAS